MNNYVQQMFYEFYLVVWPWEKQTIPSEVSLRDRITVACNMFVFSVFVNLSECFLKYFCAFGVVAVFSVTLFCFVERCCVLHLRATVQNEQTCQMKKHNDSHLC